MININFIFDKFYDNNPLGNIINISDKPWQIDGIIFPSFYYDMKIYGFDLLFKHNNDIKSNYKVNYISIEDFKNGIEGINFYPVIMNFKDFEICPWPLLYIDISLVEQINLNNIKILLIAPFGKADMGNPINYIKQANNLAKMAGIKNLKNIILMASDDWVVEEINQYNQSINNDSVRYVNINFYEKISNFVTTKDYKLIDFYSIYLSKYDKSKNYLFLNNYPKRHRFLLYKFLEFYNVINYGYVSWRNKIELSDYYKSDFLYDYRDDTDEVLNKIQLMNSELYNFILKNNFIDKKLLENDDTFNNSNLWESICLINTDWIENSYFSVVGEHQTTHNIFVSQMIYKLFYFCHPFIVNAAPGTLKYLRKIGYRTFPELFDESYDDMDESPEKILFIVNQILQYCGEEGKKKFKEKLPLIKETLEYNRNLFLKKDFNDFWANL